MQKQKLDPRFKTWLPPPRATAENIYRRFGIQMTKRHQETLVRESEKTKRFKSKLA